MDKANAKRRALSLPLPGMNRTPSAQTSDSTTNTTLALSEKSKDDLMPVQGNPGKKRAAPGARRNQPPRAKKGRHIQPDSDDDSSNAADAADEDYKEHAIPEQFVSTYDAATGKYSTVSMAHAA